MAKLGGEEGGLESGSTGLDLGWCSEMSVMDRDGLARHALVSLPVPSLKSNTFLNPLRSMVHRLGSCVSSLNHCLFWSTKGFKLELPRCGLGCDVLNNP